ncbi:MAG: YchF/TatD family DNA exonuclease [Buchnera aphidicola (Meitanaphis flavogallis)]
MFFVDSHCHIDLLNYQNLHSGIEDVLKKAFENNVKLLLTVSTSIKNFNYIKNFIKNNKNILLSCGIHPLYLNQNQNEIKQLELLSKIKQVIAIGETGLDYYYQKNNCKAQKLLFRQHIRIAIKLNKPLLIHTRCAIDDTITILQEEQAEQCIGIMHSFTENIHYARKLLDMGFYISFSGIVTFKNSENIRKVVQFIPLDRILLETDAPYLTPTPLRGQENQPAFLYHIAKTISKLKKIDTKTLANNTTQNFLKLFRLKQKLLKYIS